MHPGASVENYEVGRRPTTQFNPAIALPKRVGGVFFLFSKKFPTFNIQNILLVGMHPGASAKYPYTSQLSPNATI